MSFLERHLQAASDGSKTISVQQKELSIAALLIEVAMADSTLDPSELLRLEQNLTKRFDISEADIAALISHAKEASSQATSLHQFTHLVHQHCNEKEKFELILGMWEIAFADNTLDKHEEYLIRKVADLIYVPHSEFIRAKLKAKSAV